MKKDSLKRLLYLRFVVDFIYCLFLFVFVVVVIAVAVAIVFLLVVAIVVLWLLCIPLLSCYRGFLIATTSYV